MSESPRKEQDGPSTDSQEGTTTNPKALYIGNLDPSVDEYAIIKLFAPFGEITRIDYKFHLHGPKRGQPRGFCFVEYSTAEAAQRAMEAMHGQRLKQRFLVVSASSGSKSLHQNHRVSTDADKPRWASQSSSSASKGSRSSHPYQTPGVVAKSQQLARVSTQTKIQALEAKLAEMQKGKGTHPKS
ncbi:hypothetical protein IWQ62_000299 [Dispira parvispora]|uniref:RRM domain-containing protein n=1 Tax=Dispira parvispora TaxID=1520584 RepID=A0A9W8AYN0_9FUNG|nr:hypothetical protein IWQ62_000299 [Dispira parvispora]